jgi:Acetyltransferase (GNAT) domain
MATLNSGIPPEDWDERIKAWDGSFLQSRAWAQFQQASGRTVHFDRAEDWAWLAVLGGSRGLRYLYCAYGPAAANAAAWQAGSEHLRIAARELGVDFLRWEPKDRITPAELTKLGARRIGEVQPAHSRIVDLTQDEAALRTGLASGHRNLINGTERRGIRITTTTVAADFEQFLIMLKETAARAKITFHPDDYYQKIFEVLVPQGAAVLYIAKVDERPVAAAMFYDFNATRTYAHAGAYQELNRKVNASVSLVWQAMMDAKQAGARRFDLWGVAPDDDPNHPWAGISKFKRGFGGEPVTYAGTWDLPLRLGKYRLYSAYRKLKGRS